MFFPRKDEVVTEQLLHQPLSCGFLIFHNIKQVNTRYSTSRSPDWLSSRLWVFSAWATPGTFPARICCEKTRSWAPPDRPTMAASSLSRKRAAAQTGKHCGYRTLMPFELVKPAKNRIELNHDFCGSHWSERVTSKATTGRWPCLPSDSSASFLSRLLSIIFSY